MKEINQTIRKRTRVFKKILFYRAILIAISLLLQLAVLIFVIFKFGDYFVYFYALSTILSILVVIWILNHNTNPDYKIAWILLILVFPIFGGLFYIFFANNHSGRRSRRKMIDIQTEMIEFLGQQTPVMKDLSDHNPTAFVQSNYLSTRAYCPVFTGTQTDFLSVGEITFERLKRELSKAERYIFLEYFIIDEGLMWDSILDILVEKARQGLDIRVIYDDIGCLVTLPHGYNKFLEKQGIKCCVFNRLIPIFSLRVNVRDHRKITVIDGKVAFTGGINLADEYINAYTKYGHWKDTAVMIRGEAAWSFTIIFLTMWHHLRGNSDKLENFLPETEPTVTDGYVQPFADNPLDDEPVGEIVYLNLINKATKYIYICTPYLVLNNTMIIALTSAAKAGIDVRIITPYIGDKWYVQIVSRSYYKQLMNSGVKIYEYSPGFMHSKSIITDDEYGVIGSINMDYRSMFMHFECGVWMHKTSAIDAMKRDYLNTLNHCERFDESKLRWYRTLIASGLRIFAQFL